jgi:hypothetical protein
MAKNWLLLSACVLPIGCMSTPISENPIMYRPDAVNGCENPVLISPGQPSPNAYAVVWENVLSTIAADFEIAYSNRHEGRIITMPKIAPGYEQPWKPGSPDARERLLATLQTMRNRCIVQMRAAPDGGYLVQVVVYRELLDQKRPARATSGPIFQDASTVDRQFEVVDPAIPVEGIWIPKGRDCAYEDYLLGKIRRCQFNKD